MADYYTNFGFICPLLDDAQKEYALNLSQLASSSRLDETPLPSDFPESFRDAVEDWVFALEDTEEGLWLHSDTGGIDAVCAFVQHLLQRFNPSGCITFEWSHDCSKPRNDAFGGGAAIVTATEIKTMSTAQWLHANTNP